MGPAGLQPAALTVIRNRVFGGVLTGAVLLVLAAAGYWLFSPGGETEPSAAQSPPFDAVESDSGMYDESPFGSSPSSTSAPARTRAAAENIRRSGADVAADRGRVEASSTSAAALRIPVAGVGPGDLVDTYTQARSSGRSHDAIDIIAPRGTPVVAVAEGTVLKLFRSEQGGITLYQLDPDRRTIYYYAHLDGYATAIAEGMRLRSGQTIGFVGDTGNSGRGNYHLHFEISTTDDPERYWGGTPINPYPLLGGVAQRGK